MKYSHDDELSLSMIFSATTWFVSRIHCVSSAVLRVRVLQALVYHETVQLYCPVPGGGTRDIYWWGCALAHQKRGVLGAGTAQKGGS